MILSPIGPITIAVEDGRLTGLTIGAREGEGDGDALLDEAAAQLQAWFDRRLTAFDLPLAPTATIRGQALRGAIMAVPYGRTATYGTVARAVASGSRALGQACARNRLPIIVPCHRIVAAGGIGHYSAAGGVATKRRLLAIEGA